MRGIISPLTCHQARRRHNKSVHLKLSLALRTCQPIIFHLTFQMEWKDLNAAVRSNKYPHLSSLMFLLATCLRKRHLLCQNNDITNDENVPEQPRRCSPSISSLVCPGVSSQQGITQFTELWHNKWWKYTTETEPVKETLSHRLKTIQYKKTFTILCTVKKISMHWGGS